MDMFIIIIFHVTLPHVDDETLHVAVESNPTNVKRVRSIRV